MDGCTGARGIIASLVLGVCLLPGIGHGLAHAEPPKNMPLEDYEDIVRRSELLSPVRPSHRAWRSTASASYITVFGLAMPADPLPRCMRVMVTYAYEYEAAEREAAFLFSRCRNEGPEKSPPKMVQLSGQELPCIKTPAERCLPPPRVIELPKTDPLPYQRKIVALEDGLRDRFAAVRAPGTVSRGTGFYLTGGEYVMTNAHIVGKCNTIGLEHEAFGKTGATLLALDTRLDMAVLRADKPAPATLGLSAGEPVPAEAALVSFGGLPGLGVEKIVTDGHVLPDPDDREGVLAMDIIVDHGESGSPVISPTGAVLGMIVGRQADTGKGALVSAARIRGFIAYMGSILLREQDEPEPIDNAFDSLVAVTCQ